MDVTDRTEPRRHRPEPAHELSWDRDPDRGPITREFAVALMRAIVAEAGDRPGWSALQIMTAFDDLRDQQPAVLRRAAYAVLERKGSAADEVALAGEHWVLAELPAPRRLELVPDLAPHQRCSKHPDTLWTDCRVCRPLSKGRDEKWWAERARVAEDDRKRRERLLAEAEEADRQRRIRHGVPEPQHG
jgi:hypothetical protein